MVFTAIVNPSAKLHLEQLNSQLCEAGLNLCAVFQAPQLADLVPFLDCRHVLLIGSAGESLWKSIPQAYLDREHPVDEYSVDIVKRLLAQHVPGQSFQVLYPQSPASPQIPLQQLGTLAGWHQRSPLGIGINHRHGLWFAYRAVVALQCDVVVQLKTEAVRPIPESPCVSCEDAPCLSACPASALSANNPPDLDACVSHRVSEQSDCANTCLARLACPLDDWRYADEQIAYFYNRSLVSLQQWVSERE